jgi:DNA-binding LacI/PurR family transcriptional regulator
MAIATLQVAQHEFGLDVGKDVSIVGFDDSACASWPLVDLTTYVQPAQLMADRVAEILQHQLYSRTEEPCLDVMPGELIVRSSARRPKRGISGIAGREVWMPPRRSVVQ